MPLLLGNIQDALQVIEGVTSIDIIETLIKNHDKNARNIHAIEQKKWTKFAEENFLEGHFTATKGRAKTVLEFAALLNAGPNVLAQVKDDQKQVLKTATEGSENSAKAEKEQRTAHEAAMKKKAELNNFAKLQSESSGAGAANSGIKIYNVSEVKQSTVETFSEVMKNFIPESMKDGSIDTVHCKARLTTAQCKLEIARYEKLYPSETGLDHPTPHTLIMVRDMALTRDWKVVSLDRVIGHPPLDSAPAEKSSAPSSVNDVIKRCQLLMRAL